MTLADLLPALSPEEWSALAAWATVLVALIAGVVAVRQLGEARRLREEQAQPYVVVFADHSQAGDYVVDLVAKNFGATAATDVRVAVEPEPRRAAGAATVRTTEPVKVPAIPVLVPGQEWRTLWDTTIARGESDLPTRHEATVTFSDSRGRRQDPLRFILDWDAIFARDVVTVYGMHAAAEALRSMSKDIAGWREGPNGGLKVFARDGDARDQRARERRQAPPPPPEAADPE